MEDRVDLQRQRGPERRCCAGAVPEAGGPLHRVDRRDVIGVAARQRRDVRRAATGAARRVVVGGREAVVALVGRYFQPRVDAAGAGGIGAQPLAGKRPVVDAVGVPDRFQQRVVRRQRQRHRLEARLHQLPDRGGVLGLRLGQQHAHRRIARCRLRERQGGAADLHHVGRAVGVLDVVQAVGEHRARAAVTAGNEQRYVAQRGIFEQPLLGRQERRVRRCELEFEERRGHHRGVVGEVPDRRMVGREHVGVRAPGAARTGVDPVRGPRIDGSRDADVERALAVGAVGVGIEGLPAIGHGIEAR